MIALLLAASCAHSNYPGLKKGVFEAEPETFEGYASGVPKEETQDYLKGLFVTEPEKQQQTFATPDEVEEMSESLPDVYALGAGDVLSLSVHGRPEASKLRMVVSPDGQLAVPRLGHMIVKGETVNEVASWIEAGMGKFYTDPEVVLSLEEYANNKAFVLGRVSAPGVVHFKGEGTLLEALSMAGGLPVVAEDAFLTKCSVIRGKDQIVWIDLRELLNRGNIALNMRIKNNDIIFVPESEDELVYVMGEVKSPGPIRLKSELTVLDALMYAGGPNKVADVSEVFIIRGDGPKGVVCKVDVKDLLARADFSKNFMLKDNDVVFVSQTGISKFNYLLENMSASAVERFGAMSALRSQIWGQTGFINSSGN